jgi:hypothetical protein
MFDSVLVDARPDFIAVGRDSSQSQGSLIPPPGMLDTEAHTLLRAYICTRPMRRSLARA